MSETKRLRERIAVVLANITLGNGWKDPHEIIAKTEEMLRDPIEPDPPDPRDALIAQLRSELAACHKVVIDALAEIVQEPDNAQVETPLMARIGKLLDSASDPDDETLRLIEAQDTGGDDA